VFFARESRAGLDVAFTDRWGGVSSGPYASLDLTRKRTGATRELATNWSLLAEQFGVDGFVTMRQVHGAEVATVHSLDEPTPTCDALVTNVPEVALCVRVGDCVPVVLADADVGVVAVAHVGRPGVTAGVVDATIVRMRSLGAHAIEAWVGPHVCGGCYEVPEAMRADVVEVEPTAFAWTTWGTPAVDIGAAVVAQLGRNGCAPVHVVDTCTMESDDLFSYRRQGPASGRHGGLVVLRDPALAVPA
jgi:purine-nucleoside/S-methyl-5'-thioadenosine phosphorylase / adenosine deaminase